MTRDKPVALITGATGFVGRYLVQEILTETDWSVVGTSRWAADFSDDRARIVTCDLRDGEHVRKIIAHHTPAMIFHLAAQSYVPKSHAVPAETILNNVEAQINILEACRQEQLAATTLIVSSGEIYGPVQPDELPIRETQPFRPQSPYAVSKVTQDMLGYQYAAAYGLHIIRARPFNHIGPGQSDRFVVSAFARQVAQAEAGVIEPTILTGNLSAQRDFLDVRDVVRAYRLLIKHGEIGEVYNVASGTPTPIQAILDQLISESNRKLTHAQDPARMRPSDTPVLVGDASRLRQVTGWHPTIPLAESIHDTLEWWREQV